MHNIKSQFPIYTSHPDMVYLDHASTTQMPTSVIDALMAFETTTRFNVHRGMYPLAAAATQQYETARSTVAQFIGATTQEIIFTHGTTDGINMLARMLEPEITSEHNIVITEMEHHANLIPWQQLAQRVGCELRFIPLQADFTLDYEVAETLIDEHTRVVATTYISNTLGTVNDVSLLISRAKEVGAYSLIDAAQAVAHLPINVQALGCDFLGLSGHKMYGPTGVGVLYGKQEILETLEPVNFGGDMIDTVSYTDATWAAVPHRFEAGTPPIAGAIGLAVACDCIRDIGFEYITQHETALTKQLLSGLMDRNIQIIGPTDDSQRVGVVSFILSQVHSHDVAGILGEQGIAVRAGHHCTMPLMTKLGLPGGTVRASIGLPNTTDDIDHFLQAVDEVVSIFSL